MEKTVSIDLLIRFLHATPEQLAAIRPILYRDLPCGGRADKATGWDQRLVFRWTGRDWEVIFGGRRAFHLPPILGARYLNYLLHHPNEAVSAMDLEVAVMPEKGEARARNSVQPESDARALGEYRQELRRLQAKRSEMEAVGELERVARLAEEIQAIESALRGGGLPGTGERAYDNVRKAFGVLVERLSQGGAEERAFAEHLRTHLSIGFECMYSAPQGRCWA